MTSFIRSIFQTASSPGGSPAITSSSTATMASSSAATIKTEAAPVRPDIVKVEIVEPTVAALPVDTGKAQRAARRDAVNARRDKRKAATHDVVLSPTAFSELRIDTDEDKSKKMKTGPSSSCAVAGGLGASSTNATTTSTNVTTNKRSSACATSATNPTNALLFTPEIDPAGEERIRAMEAQLETLDPDSKEAKKKRRLIRNRMSAQLHRERKKAYVGQLEEQLLEKDRELKLLQEKLSKMMDESEKLRKAMESSVSANVAASPAPSSVASSSGTPPPSADEDELHLKEETAPSWDSPWPLSNTDQWDFTLDEDAEMVDFDTDDLLRNIGNPFAALDAANAELAKSLPPQGGEIHTAKKNIAMMMAVMFSVGFFGNTNSLCDLSTNNAFASMFEANSAKEFSQISIASRIVACLEKTSWKDFRDISSWLSQQRKNAKAEEEEQAEKEDEEMEDATPAVASPSARSDMTDSCGTPEQLLDETMDTDFPSSLIDDFVDEPFALSEANWLADSSSEPLLEDAVDLSGNDEMTVKPEPKKASSASLTSRLYGTLSDLWLEKKQVLLTVYNDKQEVLRRSVADMSSIREGMQTGEFFTPVRSDEELSTTIGEDHSISFLYPISALGAEKKSVDAADATADPVFFEVSCQLNSAAALPTLKM